MKEKVAKGIRIITVPPVITLIMLIILYYSFGMEFASPPAFAIAVIFISIIPAGAYPLSQIKKKTSDSNREIQRKMAFVMNFFGYLIALMIGFVMKCSSMLMCILVSFFLAVLILTFLNKICKIRASGHACSCVLPYLFLCYWFGSKAILICVFLYISEFWASIELKRHTVLEFISGTIVAIISFGFSIMFL